MAPEEHLSEQVHNYISHISRILAQFDAFQLARVGVEGAEPVRPIG